LIVNDKSHFYLFILNFIYLKDSIYF